MTPGVPGMNATGEITVFSGDCQLFFEKNPFFLAGGLKKRGTAVILMR
ncbi:MAG: hypothetical protein IJC73_05655 [Lentisphaeria bacterium]|nr:hypothetical protein [Lentisphaeria bacterium]